MSLIEDRKIEEIKALGFELIYDRPEWIKFYHNEKNVGVDFYHSHMKDSYQGIYMDFTIDNKSYRLNEYKPRSCLTLIRRFLAKDLLKATL